jgi:hypothetical protein
MWKIKNEPKMYEYRIPIEPRQEAAESPEIRLTAGGLLLLALLGLIFGLTEGIEGEGK